MQCRRSGCRHHKLDEHASSFAVAGEPTDEVVSAGFLQSDEIVSGLVLQYGVQGIARCVIAHVHLLYIVCSRIIPKTCNAASQYV